MAVNLSDGAMAFTRALGSGVNQTQGDARGINTWWADRGRLEDLPAPSGGTDDRSDGPGGWPSCLQQMLRHDNEMVAGWNDEIDTILIFAGLFSAILTAFSVESYKLLQQDPEQTSTDLLAQISLQLQSFSLNPAFANSTHTPSLKRTHIPVSAVRINSLWFTSLVLGLVSALTAIFARQWLREYAHWQLSSSRDSVRIRQFRHDGLMSWRVPTVMYAISILLQIAVVLFLVGLVDFLWTLNRIVAGTVTAFVAIPLLLALASAIIPTFAPNCPYKSPLAFFIYRASALTIWMLGQLREYRTKYLIIKGAPDANVGPSYAEHRTRPLSESMPATWVLRDVGNVQRQQPKALDSDSHALDWIHAYTFNENVRDTILTECLPDISKAKRAQVAVELVAKAADYRLGDLVRYIRAFGTSPRLSELKAKIHMKLLVAVYADACPCSDLSCVKINRTDIHALTERLSTFSPTTQHSYWQFLKYRIIQGSKLSASEILSFALGLQAAAENSSGVQEEDARLVLQWGTGLPFPGDGSKDSGAASVAFDTAITSVFSLLESMAFADIHGLHQKQPELLDNFFAHLNHYILARVQRHSWRCPAEWIIFIFGGTTLPIPPYLTVTMRDLALQRMFEPSEEHESGLGDALMRATVPLYLWDVDHAQLFQGMTDVRKASIAPQIVTDNGGNEMLIPDKPVFLDAIIHDWNSIAHAMSPWYQSNFSMATFLEQMPFTESPQTSASHLPSVVPSGAGFVAGTASFPLSRDSSLGKTQLHPTTDSTLPQTAFDSTTRDDRRSTDDTNTEAGPSRHVRFNDEMSYQSLVHTYNNSNIIPFIAPTSPEEVPLPPSDRDEEHDLGSVLDDTTLSELHLPSD